jgi:hypothetical protein
MATQQVIPVTLIPQPMGQTYLESTEGGELLFLNKDRIVVGASPDCDIVIDNPTVSGHHAMLRKLGMTWLIYDLNSANGTRVNSKKITEGEELTGAGAMNSGRDLIALGTARYFFCDGKTRPIVSEEKKDIPVNGKPPSAASPVSLLDSILASSPFEFEKLIGRLFESLGFEAKVTQQSGDGGIDVEATYNGDNTGKLLWQGRYLIQCKRYNPKNRVLSPEVQRFKGAIQIEGAARGIFVRTSSFSRGAKKYAQAVGITLIGGDELVRLIARCKVL